MADFDRAKALLEAALAELTTKLAAEGLEIEASGLSLFLVQRGDAVGQVSAFAGDLIQLGMFAPEWPWGLTDALLNDGPTEAFAGERAETVN